MPKFNPPLARAALILLLLHGYIGARLLPDLPFGLPGSLVGAAALAASAALIPFGFRARRARANAAPDPLMWAGLIALGAFSTLLVLTFIRDVALLVLWVLHASFAFAVPLRPYARWSAVAVPVLTAVLTLIGYGNARRVAAVRRVDVPIEALPAALHGFTIVQITDVHVGATIRRDDVQAVVDVVNGLAADMVAITGDLVDGSVAHLAQQVAPLSRLTARHGAYVVTGNHEYYSGVHPWVDEFRRLGLKCC